MVVLMMLTMTSIYTGDYCTSLGLGQDGTDNDNHSAGEYDACNGNTTITIKALNKHKP